MKICFLSLNSYPTLANKNLGYAGGVEVKQVDIGKELVDRSYAVCFATYFKDSKSIVKVDGIE